MDPLATRGGRRLLFAALYLSEGAPIGYIWWALPTRLRLAGVPVAEITALTGALVLPWALKFLWAPAVDALRSKRFGLRSWIVASQLAMGATLLPMLGLDLRTDLAAVGTLLMAHAVAAATQDVAVDALAIARVPEAERGTLNGWMQAGMLGGRALFGGVALALEPTVGSSAVVLALVAVTWSSTALLLFADAGSACAIPHGGAGWREVGASLRAAVRERNVWLGIGFALVGGAGFEAAGALLGPFLVDRGTPQESVARLLALPASLGLAAGALAGGHASDRLGRRRASALFLLLAAAAVTALARLDAGAAPAHLDVVVAGLYVAIGLFTAASYALFMDLTDPRLGATQFSAYMGATNACESWSSVAAGRAVRAFGYPPAFVSMAAVSLLALPLLALLRPRSKS